MTSRGAPARDVGLLPMRVDQMTGDLADGETARRPGEIEDRQNIVHRRRPEQFSDPDQARPEARGRRPRPLAPQEDPGGHQLSRINGPAMA